MRYGMYRRSSLRSKTEQRYPVSCARDEPPAQHTMTPPVQQRCGEPPRRTMFPPLTRPTLVAEVLLGFPDRERDLRPFKGQLFGPCALGRWPRSPGRELFNRAAAPKQSVGVAAEFATELGETGWDWNAPPFQD
jgi:hypothetical protein